ncbi:olfactory receptor 14A16-like [Suricata suricatta]|uniref:olfactory receptor 14A16-like n=1 Tax=Suricata suricatta TaxID=37032 RepID=UPI0011556841|nr:olfactory receptor 14A16-like [Suricata suricatta]
MSEKLTNVTLITEFLLMGFPDDEVLQRLYATFFSLIYMAALIGNFRIIAITTIDQHFQYPIYFFLKNLSLIDICYISVTVPKSIINSLNKSYSISFMGCASQVFLVIFFAGTEFALLLVMSYDRYAAICCPLHYETIMNRGACVQMVTASWLSGCVYGSIHVAGTFSRSYCRAASSSGAYNASSHPLLTPGPGHRSYAGDVCDTLKTVDLLLSF